MANYAATVGNTLQLKKKHLKKSMATSSCARKLKILLNKYELWKQIHVLFGRPLVPLA